jgi:hypothetical protein
MAVHPTGAPGYFRRNVKPFKWTGNRLNAGYNISDSQGTTLICSGPYLFPAKLTLVIASFLKESDVKSEGIVLINCGLGNLLWIVPDPTKLKAMAQQHKFCQSCGMHLKMDPGQGGTHADGSKSVKYCSYCYQNGAFTDDFQSPAEMMAFVKEKLKEQGVPGWKRWLYTLPVPKLERWRKVPA